MTMQIQVGLVSSVNTNMDAVGLEVTPHGAWKEVFRLNERDRATSLPESLWNERAILICEGVHDFGDGVRPEDEYWVNNPLVEFLKREHPAQGLKDELRQRIAKLEAENERLRDDLHKAESRIVKMKAAMKE